MQQFPGTQSHRDDLTAAVVRRKQERHLSWAELAEGTGFSVAYVTAALLGQHALPSSAAELVGERLGLEQAQIQVLQEIPLRGSLATSIPVDPTIYRFYEIVQVYGTTLKALIHEQFGDGIMSAINFRFDVNRVEEPDGNQRVVITLDGKFLPFKPF